MEKKASKDTLIIRVLSAAGRSRIEVSKTATLDQLCTIIAGHLKLPHSDIVLFKDSAYKEKILAPRTKQVGQAGVVDGMEIYINNKEAKLPVVQPPAKAEDKKEEIKKLPKKEVKKEGKKEIKKDAHHTPVVPQEKKATDWKKTLCSHGPNGKCLNCAGVTDEEVRQNVYDEKCDHPPHGKCPKCLNKGFIKDAKHISFDHYLNELKLKCKDLHPPEARCHNCLPPTQISYKLKPMCKEHAPYPLGMCTKCMPPTANLMRQPYRHVDYVQFMNIEEINNFMTYWSGNFVIQRLGYLYGYFSKDPNYPDGVRAIVEAVYEPPQKGDFSDSTELPDPDSPLVNAVAQALGLTRVGWIFTSTNVDVFLSSGDVLKIAKIQEQNCIVHGSGAKISKFVTVKAKVVSDKGETGLDASMVSDQCQALVRDNIFSGVKDDSKLMIRKPKPNEVIPSVIYGKSGQVDEVPTDYFVVNVSHGAPIDKQGFNTLQFFDFPKENRALKPQKNFDLKGYFQKHGKKDPKAYLDFHMLIYLAKLIDVETVAAVIDTSLNNKPPPEGIVDIINSLAQ